MKVVSVRCLHHLKLTNEEGSDSQVLMPFKLTNEQGSDSTGQAVMLCIAKVKTSGSGECIGGHSKSKSQTGGPACVRRGSGKEDYPPTK